MSTNSKENISKTLRPYSKYTSQLTRPTLRAIIQICVHYLESNTYPEDILKKAIIKLSTTDGAGDLEHFHYQFAAILQFFELYLRTARGVIKEDELVEILKDLKLEDSLIEDISNVLQKHRKNLSACLYEAKQLHLSSPTCLSWRINISLLYTDSAVSSRLNRSIVLQFKSSDNSICKTIEVSVAQFHKIRYNVALLLNEMQLLENRSIMKK